MDGHFCDLRGGQQRPITGRLRSANRLLGKSGGMTRVALGRLGLPNTSASLQGVTLKEQHLKKKPCTVR